MDTQMRFFYMLSMLSKLAAVSEFDTRRRRSRGRTRRMESSSRVLHNLTKNHRLFAYVFGRTCYLSTQLPVTIRPLRELFVTLVCVSIQFQILRIGPNSRSSHQFDLFKITLRLLSVS